jgi:hypothetical protein
LNWVYFHQHLKVLKVFSKILMHYVIVLTHTYPQIKLIFHYRGKCWVT